jgi:hypothetical protein
MELRKRGKGKKTVFSTNGPNVRFELTNGRSMSGCSTLALLIEAFFVYLLNNL